MHTRERGEAYEHFAMEYLQDQGLQLITRNYQCKSGEIDLIMRTKPKVLVFAEVRYRQRKDYGAGFDTVDISKQRKIIRTAQHFLQKYRRFSSYDCRFDVVSIGTQSDGQRSMQEIDWIPNAFDTSAMMGGYCY